jgi:hypothetical protein
MRRTLAHQDVLDTDYGAQLSREADILEAAADDLERIFSELPSE